MHRLEDGTYRTRSRRVVQLLRMNIGTIVEAETLKVRIRRGPVLGEVEEYFAVGLEPGDSFIFAGRMLRFEGIREQTLVAIPAPGTEPKVPAYLGGRLPLTTHLAERVRSMLASTEHVLPNGSSMATGHPNKLVPLAPFRALGSQPAFAHGFLRSEAYDRQK